MEIRERVASALEPRTRELFLRTLGHRLGISAREIFIGEEPSNLRQARACNEMMIAIWAQLAMANQAGADGYPDSDFLQILLSKADMGDARAHLRSALESSLDFVNGITESE